MPESDPEDPGPLDERTRRRADFAGGHPVRLRDGQTWTLATPGIIHRMEGKIPIPYWSFGEGYGDLAEFFNEGDRFIHAVANREELSSWEHYAGPVVRYATLLLARNYHLTKGETVSLLMPHDGDDPAELLRMMAAVLVATFHAPAVIFQRAADRALGQARNPHDN